MSGQARRKHMRVLKHESGVPLDRATKLFLNDHPSYAAKMARMVKRSNARKHPYASSDATPSPGTDSQCDITPRASPRSTTPVGYASQSRSVASVGLSNSSASVQRTSAASPLEHLNTGLPAASGHRVTAAASITVPSTSLLGLPGTSVNGLDDEAVGEVLASATTSQLSPTIKQETPADAFFQLRLQIPAGVSQENISNEAPLSAPALVDPTPDYIKQPVPIRAALPDWVQADLLTLSNQTTEEEEDDPWMQSDYYDKATLEQARSVIALSRSMPPPPPFEDLPIFANPPVCSCMDSDCELLWTFPGQWGHRFEPFTAVIRAMSRTPSPFLPSTQELAPFSGQRRDQNIPVVSGKRGRDDPEGQDERREGSSKKARTSV
ncbi:hypothetical protein CYLTODRAFT_422275 [Cylindrobasidium torrendii FP15055 ss-10]|uniref:Uncharacterized protein n=1 Tax=Cylindrobasidium torrendii FP15055 ss-10 TaxID=1314674 RepID=A0A0D7BDV2_9AGAR|nr:hypothetical protein CYLTODRAFT_422275 [Cylindrobasidium torrendii FP15055 ss-10]